MLRKINEGPPWTVEEFRTLSDLLVELARNPAELERNPARGIPLNALLGGLLFPERAQEAAKQEEKRIDQEIARARKRLDSDPLYKKLRKNESFRALSSKFESRLKRERKEGRRPRAEFDFIFLVLLAARSFFVAQVKRLANRRSRGFNDRKSARRHIAALLKLRSIGNVELIDFKDDRLLTSLLEKLDSQMQRRKRRETAKTPATNAIAFLARQLSVCFNMSAPTVLEEFNTWLRLGINGTTIREIAAREKKKWDAELEIKGRGWASFQPCDH